MIELRFPGQCLIEMILSGNSSFERTSLKEQVLKEQVLLRSTKYKVERRTFRAESRKQKVQEFKSA